MFTIFYYFYSQLSLFNVWEVTLSPFFSIIIPLYNGEEYIERALSSCIIQSFDMLEIIVVDDCSQDHSREIVTSCIQRDARIKLFQNPQNLGTFRTRLEGIKYAQGEYCLFLDADDFINKQMCEILYMAIQKKKYADIVGFDSQYFPKKNIPISHIPFKTLTKNILEHLFIRPTTPSVLIWNKAYRSIMLKQIYLDIQPTLNSFPHIKVGDDILQSFIIYCYAKKSIGINKKLYYYCDSNISITRKQDEITKEIRIKNLSNLFTIIDTLEKKHFFKKQENYQKAKDKLIKILQASICLEERYSPQIFAYPKACIHSLKYYRKPQTYIRILLYLISFGKIKL